MTVNGSPAVVAAGAVSAAGGTQERLEAVAATLAGAPGEAEIAASLTAIAAADDALCAVKTAMQMGTPYQLMLIDSHMPMVDGCELAAEFSQLQLSTPMVMSAWSASCSVHGNPPLASLKLLAKRLDFSCLARISTAARANSG